jgi:hypothetical protein
MSYRFAVSRLAAVASLFVMLLLAVPVHGVVIPPSSMGKWDVKEIVLCTSAAYADWQAYQAVRVTGLFSGPNGTNLTVNGFWDGKGTAPCGLAQHAFKVRFTPQVQGTWTFQITNNQGNAELTVLPAEAGQITVGNPVSSPAGKTPRGFLRRDQPAGSPTAHFQWGTGEYQYVWGQTYYQIVNREAAGGTATWQNAVDTSTGGGTTNYTMNKIRLLISPWNASGGVDSQPYKRDGAGLLNRDQINVPHWQRLEKIIRYLNERNVIAEVILFRDKGVEDFLGTPTQDCRYLRYATSRLAAYPNVTWSLSNEWDRAKNVQSYWHDLGSAIRGDSQTTCTGAEFSTPLDPWFTSGGKSRILTIHPLMIDPDTNMPQACFQFATDTWPTAASLQYHRRNTDDATYQGDRIGYESIACNKSVPGQTTPCALPLNPLPVSNDEYGYIGNVGQTQDQHRNVIWGIATGGGYGTAGDARGNPAPIQSSIWAAAAEYDDIKRLVSFFTSANKGIEFWKMAPQTGCQVNTRVHTLAEPGRQYITYTATGANFTVANFQPGNYRRIWYDPRNADPNNPAAATSDTACVNITVNSFTPPAGSPGDWVLLLKKTPTCL